VAATEAAHEPVAVTRRAPIGRAVPKHEPARWRPHARNLVERPARIRVAVKRGSTEDGRERPGRERQSNFRLASTFAGSTSSR
jgi:hypothetical protein